MSSLKSVVNDTIYQEIDVIDELNLERFNELYYNKKPVIFKKAILRDKCFTNWTNNYLKSAIGSKEVDVKYSQGGLYNISNVSQYVNIKVPFTEAVDLISKEVNSQESYYLQQLSIPEIFPELMNDLSLPTSKDPSAHVFSINLWMGSAGCSTHLHFDRSQNFLAQVRGRKEMILFSPEDSVYLYPNTDKKFDHVSRVQITDPDHEQFPLFRKATKYYCLLEEGDLLYLTPYWWHQVQSLDTSISVNYWWNRFDIDHGLGLETMGLEEVCYLINSFITNGFSIDHTDESGEPLLIKAIHLDFEQVLEAMLILGANPDVQSKTLMPGSSAYQVAVNTGKENMVDILNRYK